MDEEQKPESPSQTAMKSGALILIITGLLLGPRRWSVRKRMVESLEVRVMVPRPDEGEAAPTINLTINLPDKSG